MPQACLVLVADGQHGHGQPLRHALWHRQGRRNEVLRVKPLTLKPMKTLRKRFHANAQQSLLSMAIGVKVAVSTCEDATIAQIMSLPFLLIFMLYNGSLAHLVELCPCECSSCYARGMMLL